MVKFNRLLKIFFIAFSLCSHLIIFVALAYYLENKITSHWRWPIIVHYFSSPIDSSDVYQLEGKGFTYLPRERWVKVHQQNKDDTIYFNRQAHGGSAFDTLRGRILLFGSDTHEQDWSNTVYAFNMETLRWSSPYESDSPETYIVNDKGFPVAGANSDHPWAMHTFGALAYDEVFDRLVIGSFPGHLHPNRFGKSLGKIWSKIKNHPTWAYDFHEEKWNAYAGNKIDFFPYSIAYDSTRGIVTGFRPNGIFEWEGNDRGWVKVGERVYSQWHTNVVYDSGNAVFVLFGGNEMTGDTYVYKAGDKVAHKMPVSENPPPAGQSVPLAYNEKQGKVVALINVDGYAQTWTYEYSKNKWERNQSANFPYRLGMNYTMEYDAQRDIVVLVSSSPYDETAVWVLRL